MLNYGHLVDGMEKSIKSKILENILCDRNILMFLNKCLKQILELQDIEDITVLIFYMWNSLT